VEGKEDLHTSIFSRRKKEVKIRARTVWSKKKEGVAYQSNTHRKEERFGEKGETSSFSPREWRIIS